MVNADGQEDPALPARPTVGHLFLGAATLAGERLHLIGTKQTPTIAVVVGLVSEGRDAAGRAAGRMVDGARQAVPTSRLRHFLDDAATRGKQTMASSKDETAHWLQSAADGPLKWAEQSLIPRMVDDLTPYMVNTVAPKMIDGVLPQIRTTVVPAIIEDLTTDPRVLGMVTEQSHGAVAAATDDLREATATADDRVENAFRNAFRRNAKT
jgi:hypothetical protein